MISLVDYNVNITSNCLLILSVAKIKPSIIVLIRKYSIPDRGSILKESDKEEYEHTLKRTLFTHLVYLVNDVNSSLACNMNRR